MVHRLLRLAAAGAFAGLTLASPAAAIIILDKSVHLAPYSAGQAVRVHAANLGDPGIGGNCAIAISWFRPDGTPAGPDARVLVAPGTVEVADFVDGRTPFGGHRAVRIVAVLGNAPDETAPCMVQFEVFDRLTGRTQYLGTPEFLPAVQRPQ
jgi:hypothetical protein